MPAKTTAGKKAAGAIAGITARCGPDDPRIPELRRDLRAAELEDYIRTAVDAAPPFTDEQRVRLAALLRPSGPDGAV